MRSQQDARRGGVEGVPHIAGRVVRRHVEQLEIGQVVLDLPAAVDLETEVGENGVDVAGLHIKAATGISAAVLGVALIVTLRLRPAGLLSSYEFQLGLGRGVQLPPVAVVREERTATPSEER